jgi:hypothetical protein
VHVLVDGERDRGARVAQALGDDLHRHAVGEQQGGVGVAEVVQSDRRQSLLPQRLLPERRPRCQLGVPNQLASSRTGYPTGMQIPKAMVVERIRTAGGAEAADRADAELPEKVDTERDAELLRRFDLDPRELAEGLGGQSPAVG